MFIGKLLLTNLIMEGVKFPVFSVTISENRFQCLKASGAWQELVLEVARCSWLKGVPWKADHSRGAQNSNPGSPQTDGVTSASSLNWNPSCY